MVNLYKSKVLAYIEGKTPAIYHVAQSALQRVDNIQEQFMRSAGLTDIEAICKFRLSPLCSRRDMALLGVIHRTVLGLGPEQSVNISHSMWRVDIRMGENVVADIIAS